VFTILVGNQMGRRLESSAAWQVGEAVELVTNERLLVQMDELDVSVERVLLAERLIARRVADAKVFGLCHLMRLLVLFQALSRVEALVAVGPVADVVSDIVVLGLDVVLQVALTEEGLVTALLGTGKRTVVGVRTFVLLKSHRTRVRFCAAFKVAGVLVLTRLGSGSGRLRRRWLDRGT
jgi:hypothetical protein